MTNDKKRARLASLRHLMMQVFRHSVIRASSFSASAALDTKDHAQDTRQTGACCWAIEGCF